VETAADDIRSGETALRVDYDGYSAVRVAEQLMFLDPGRYRLSAEARAEAGDPAARLAWTVTCAPGDLRVLSVPAAARSAANWTRVSAEFTVPAGCAGQWLRIDSRPGERRAPTVAWFDRVTVTRVSGAPE
jgi:hypothetical protein